VVSEELSRGYIGVGSLGTRSEIAAELILGGGTAAQKQHWLPRLATGEAIGCFGLTEPDFGSNPSGMKTRARRDGDYWILDGEKTWITNGSLADVALVWARTDEGIRGFLVEKGTPGFTAAA
jgi:glutaryl-CoA dehydrogenase